jgi:hypothetical protein
MAIRPFAFRPIVVPDGIIGLFLWYDLVPRQVKVDAAPGNRFETNGLQRFLGEAAGTHLFLVNRGTCCAEGG